MRQARDATLEVPTLILPAIQVNVRAGKLPPEQGEGQKMPGRNLRVRVR